MKPLRAIDRAMTVAVTILLVVLFFVMLCLSSAQIGMRYFFESGIPWADIAARNLVLWVGFLGAVLATGQDKHFQLDILTRFLGRRTKLSFEVFAELFAAVVCIFLVGASERFLLVGLDHNGVAFLGIPMIVVASIIPAGFGLMAAQFVLKGILLVGERFETVSREKDRES